MSGPLEKSTIEPNRGPVDARWLAFANRENRAIEPNPAVAREGARSRKSRRFRAIEANLEPS
jgi:hypothetical protein